MNLYITDTFSISMLNRKAQKYEETWKIPRPMDPKWVKEDIIPHAQRMGTKIVSRIKDTTLASLISKQLGVNLEMDESLFQLDDLSFDAILVAQYVGPRLPEGTKELPEGAHFEWWIV